MKHNIYLFPLLACTALLAEGCADNDAPQADDPSVISFAHPAVSILGIQQTDSDNRSRSTLVSSFPIGTEFKVLGYCIPRTVGNTNTDDRSQAATPWNNKAAFSRPDVFYNTTVTIGSGSTSYGTLKPWYTTGSDGNDATQFRYSFMAYYPATGSFTVTPSNDATIGAPKFTFSIPSAAYNDHTRIPDAMIATRFDHRPSDGKIALTFRHILTGIRFRINNYSDDDLVLTNVTLSGNFYRSATFDFSTTTVKQTTPALSAGNSYAGNFRFIENEAVITGNGSQLLGQGDEGTTLLLLTNPDATPASVDQGTNYFLGSDKVLTITYRMGNSAPITTTIPFKLSFKTVPATRYTANLNFVGDEFVLIFLADNNENWENGSDNDLIIN